MQQQIITSTFVILVCTPTFRRRFEGTETRGNGHGATWEGLIATQLLYDNGSRNEKLVPVLFEDATIEAVPTVLRPCTRYSMLAEYDGLLRHITAQPAIVPPPVGALKVMPPLARTTRAPQTPSVAVPASGGVDIILSALTSMGPRFLTTIPPLGSICVTSAIVDQAALRDPVFDERERAGF